MPVDIDISRLPLVRITWDGTVDDDAFRQYLETTADLIAAHPGTVLLHDAHRAGADGNRVAETIPTTAVRVRIGVKETGHPRPICYCFGFTSEDIEARVGRSGVPAEDIPGPVDRGNGPTVAEEIRAKCKRGLDRCEIENPRGACCLGDVQRIAASLPPGAMICLLE